MVDMTPAPTTYEKGKLYQILVADFKLDPDQPRKVIDPDALAELTASIEKSAFSSPFSSARQNRAGSISWPESAAMQQPKRRAS